VALWVLTASSSTNVINPQQLAIHQLANNCLPVHGHGHACIALLLVAILTDAGMAEITYMDPSTCMRALYAYIGMLSVTLYETSETYLESRSYGEDSVD